MKNYLFAPFDDDNDKIETFNHLKNYLSSGHRNELIMFIGRLESYYDTMLDMGTDGINDLNGVLTDLRIENEDLIKACKLLKEDNKRLKDELQAVNDDYNNDHKVHNEYEDGLLDEVNELKAEIKRKDTLFKDYSKRAREQHECGEEYERELKAELEKANSNNMRYSSLKEYKQEAEEYFHHNPKAKSVSFYMLDDCDVDEIDGSQHDPIVEIYNEGSN